MYKNEQDLFKSLEQALEQMFNINKEEKRPEHSQGSSLIPVNIYKAKDGLSLRHEFLVSGFSKEEIDLTVDTDLNLVVSGEKKDKENFTKIYSEFGTKSKIYRKVSTDKDLDFKKPISAVFENGILIVTVFYKDKEQPVKVDIS